MTDPSTNGKVFKCGRGMNVLTIYRPSYVVATIDGDDYSVPMSYQTILVASPSDSTLESHPDLGFMLCPFLPENTLGSQWHDAANTNDY